MKGLVWRDHDTSNVSIILVKFVDGVLDHTETIVDFASQPFGAGASIPQPYQTK